MPIFIADPVRRRTGISRFGGHCLIEVGHGPGHDDDLRVRRRDSMTAPIVVDARIGKGRQGTADPFEPRVIDREREEIGVGKVAIVVRFFLRAHDARLAGDGVIKARLLFDASAAFEHSGLPLDLMIDGAADEPEGVQVFDLGARSQWLARASYGNVGVAAQRAFLHVAVARAGIHEDLAQSGEIRAGLFGV
jgi:hypothetical protein